MMFSINELIYIIETIYTDFNLDEYFFKKTIQEKLNKMNFNEYKIFIEKCEKIACSLEKTTELNSLNNLHFEINEEISKELKEYVIK